MSKMKLKRITYIFLMLVIILIFSTGVFANQAPTTPSLYTNLNRVRQGETLIIYSYSYDPDGNQIQLLCGTSSTQADVCPPFNVQGVSNPFSASNPTCTFAVASNAPTGQRQIYCATFDGALASPPFSILVNVDPATTPPAPSPALGGIFFQPPSQVIAGYQLLVKFTGTTNADYCMFKYKLRYAADDTYSYPATSQNCADYGLNIPTNQQPGDYQFRAVACRGSTCSAPQDGFVNVVSPYVGPSITGIQGYDPATNSYTTTIYANKYLYIYGAFTSPGNTVTISGHSGYSMIYQSASNIHVQLGSTTGPGILRVTGPNGATSEYNINIIPLTTPQPSIPPPTFSPSCSGTTPIATISWNDVESVRGGYVVDIDNNNNFDDGYWNKHVPSGTTTSADGFNNAVGGTAGQQFTLNRGATYWIRIYYLATGRHSPTASFTASNCAAPPATIPSPTVLPSCFGSTSKATISWQHVNGGVRYYTIDIDNDNDWNNGYWKESVLAGITNSIAPNELNPFNPVQGASGNLILNAGSTYRLRVNYAYISMDNQNSPTVSFTADNCATCPTSMPPVEAVVLPNNRATLGWQGPPGAASYNIRLEEYEQGTSTVTGRRIEQFGTPPIPRNCEPHYYCVNGVTTPPITNVLVNPGRGYKFWVDPIILGCTDSVTLATHPERYFNGNTQFAVPAQPSTQPTQPTPRFSGLYIDPIFAAPSDNIYVRFINQYPVDSICRYRYRREGNEYGGFIAVSCAQSVISGLASGRYNIEGQVCNSNGAGCSESITYSFTVLAPSSVTPPTSTVTIPPPTILPSCSGSTPTAQISWSDVGGTSGGYYVDLDDNNNFDTGLWNKRVLSDRSTTAPDGFNPAYGASGAITLNSGSTYYVRVYYYASNRHSQTASFTVPNCVTCPTSMPPVEANVVDNRATLGWQGPSRATSWDVRLEERTANGAITNNRIQENRQIGTNCPNDPSTGRPLHYYCVNGVTTQPLRDVPVNPGMTYRFWVSPNIPYCPQFSSQAILFPVPALPATPPTNSIMRIDPPLLGSATYTPQNRFPLEPSITMNEQFRGTAAAPLVIQQGQTMQLKVNARVLLNPPYPIRAYLTKKRASENAWDRIANAYGDGIGFIQAGQQFQTNRLTELSLQPGLYSIYVVMGETTPQLSSSEELFFEIRIPADAQLCQQRITYSGPGRYRLCAGDSPQINPTELVFSDNSRLTLSGVEVNPESPEIGTQIGLKSYNSQGNEIGSASRLGTGSPPFRLSGVRLGILGRYVRYDSINTGGGSRHSVLLDIMDTIPVLKIKGMSGGTILINRGDEVSFEADGAPTAQPVFITLIRVLSDDERPTLLNEQFKDAQTGAPAVTGSDGSYRSNPFRRETTLQWPIGNYKVFVTAGSKQSNVVDFSVR